MDTDSDAVLMNYRGGQCLCQDVVADLYDAGKVSTARCVALSIDTTRPEPEDAIPFETKCPNTGACPQDKTFDWECGMCHEQVILPSSANFSQLKNFFSFLKAACQS